MKKTGFIIAMCLLPFLGYAQNVHTVDQEGSPGRVEPVDAGMLVARQHDYEYYLSQSNAWEEQTKAKPDDAKAWLNYFRHTRYMCFFDDEINRDSLLSSIVDKMEKAIPDTYEYYTCLHFTQYGDEATVSAEKALGKLPAKKTLFDYDTWYNYIRLNKDKTQYESFAKDYLASGLYSQELIQNNMNEMDGMAKNAIFIGNGDATVIPKWLIIDGMGKHRDKLVLCYSFLQIPDYCKKIYDSLGIGEVPEHEGEFEDYEDYQEYMKSIIMTIVERTGRELYVSKYNGYEIEDLWYGDLYEEGLVYHYSPKNIDVIKKKKYNYEKVYDLSYVLQPMGKDAWITDKNMSMDLIPAFSDLLAYYKKHDKKRYSELHNLLSQALERAKDAITDDSRLEYYMDLLNGEFDD